MAPVNSPYSLLPPVVKLLLIANGATFLLELALGDSLIVWLALWPIGTSSAYSPFVSTPQFQPWQLVTYSFLHGGLMHLVLNMYALWLFGARMENLWGSRAFAIYYFFCVIGAGAIQLIVAAMSSEIYPTVGASGGVFGLLLAFGLTFPEQVLVLMFPPVALKAKWFVLIYGAIELWSGVTGTQGRRGPLRPPGRYVVRLPAVGLLAHASTATPVRGGPVSFFSE